MNNNKDNHISSIHKPVFVNEALSYLNIRQDKVYVDCTLGLGGHSIEILNKLKKGQLIGMDQDLHALKLAKERLKKYNNCHLLHTNFVNLKEVLKRLKIQKITGGVILDLGVSSMQFDDPNRGFSFKADAPLDMRMNTNQEQSAYDIVNKFKEKDLADAIYKYGEERFSRRIARSIVSKRPLKSTKELADIVLRCYPKHKHFKAHPATKTFQAIRILVNKELETLEKFLLFIPELLAPHSRLTVISFHSLEDRIVKIFFKEHKELKILTKKPIQPSLDEIRNNPRARSAKLRAVEKI